MSKTLRLILGDQLNPQHSWFNEISDKVEYVMIEARSETDYVVHHVQKILGIFAAMRRFSNQLRVQGHRVSYIRLGDKSNRGSIKDNLLAMLEEGAYDRFEYQLSDEWRVDEMLQSLCAEIRQESSAYDTEHFYTERSFLAGVFSGKKQTLMESFYRALRKAEGVLMDGESPVTGQWNYDASNRKKLPKEISIPRPFVFHHDVSDILQELESSGVKSIGKVKAKEFIWPLDRKDALALLDHFVNELLPLFGDYQDAMTDRDWSLFHSRLSFALNLKMLSPREIVDRVEEAWRSDPDRVHISQAEGFIRQILGWREYMRGIYWWKMPEYAKLNYFDHQRELPRWYWTGETKMSCLRTAINQSLEHAYAHHIQRLMLTGNFALLAGCDPDEVDHWYLGIYIDAFDWVEITNTRGMSQFADGGIVGTKPYVSSASYIHKMSDHCTGCHYDHKKKTGENACPFNPLYWHFHHRHREKLESNPRIGMMYRTWDKMSPDTKNVYLEQAEKYLSEIDYL